MNIMEFELIRNEEAQEVARETGLDWMDLVDFQSLFDLSYDMRRRKLDEEELRYHFHNYFWDLAADLQWQAIAWEVEHDEVSVTRCKFCKHYSERKDGPNTCLRLNLVFPDPEDYCSKAERLTWHDFRKEER